MAQTKLWAIILVIVMTGITSTAQVFYKLAAHPGLALKDVLLSHFLWIGLALYGVGFVMLNIAFRGGEVSVLYPIIATSYIWVAVISYFRFSEVLNVIKILGILFIVVGVALMSSAGKKSDAISKEVTL